MPVPTLVTDLSTTLASNSPAGSDNVFPDLDNYVRAMSGFIASIRDNTGNGWVSPYLPLAGGTVTGATIFSSTVALNGALSGTGLTTYLASPPAIGGTTPAAVSSSNLSYTGTLTGGTGVMNLGSGQLVKDSAGNLGLGVTPSAWDAGEKAFQLPTFGSIAFTGQYGRLCANAYINGGAFKYTATGSATQYFQSAGQHQWLTAPSGAAGNAISFTQTMTLDASGNLGLGVTPSAWATSSYKAFDIGAGGALVGTSNSVQIWSNSFDGVSGARYKVNGAAATLQLSSGGFNFFTAPSGTAGNAISFTQTMTLDASGNLIVNDTTAVGKFTVKQASDTTSGGIAIVATNGNGAIISYLTDGGLTFRNGGLERARITSGGDLLVGKTASGFDTVGIELQPGGTLRGTTADSTAVQLQRKNSDGYIAEFWRASSLVGNISVTTSATAYNTSSDYRLKDNPQPLTNSGAFIDALKPKTWEWKSDGSKGVGFIAHEAQAVSPSSVVGEKDAVDADGKPVMQAMEYGSAEFIANIIAELKSLRARVAALETP